jgi:hypothetical protein
MELFGVMRQCLRASYNMELFGHAMFEYGVVWPRNV